MVTVGLRHLTYLNVQMSQSHQRSMSGTRVVDLRQLIDTQYVTRTELQQDYSVYVSRQASRRSWHIGQTHPGRVGGVSRGRSTPSGTATMSSVPTRRSVSSLHPSVYRPSYREYLSRIESPEYPSGVTVRRVSCGRPCVPVHGQTVGWGA